MKMLKTRWPVVLMALFLCVGITACGNGTGGDAESGTDEGDTTSAEAESPDTTEEGSSEESVASTGADTSDTTSNEEPEALSLDRVTMAADNGDFMDSLIWSTADARYWPELGFTEPVEATVTQDFVAGLVGGSAWVVQGENNLFWSAMAEGSVPMRSIGVHMDGEAWILGIDEDVDPANLEGLKITGGSPGERNETIGREILTELGFDPDNVEWITVPGGPEERFRALAADQVDMAVLQPELEGLLEDIGGEFIYDEMRVIPQAGWAVTAETMENNRDAVCAFVEGQLAARQWLSEGPDRTANQDEAVELAAEYGLEPTEGDLKEWGNFLGDVLSVDGGSPAPSFDEWTEQMALQGLVPD
ncbi:MAG: hypothetical protein GEU79_17280, partial [Acidimicrobiia bacterium]|nr:hypothetical protein [Acidimicrobiia bacterium]